ncbi:MAG: citrate lyase holo-[acyl-carrier protein] synthase [Acholeplasmataceae bacterium]|nr:citrate lyase holo-[acyl-carrier protein] synthase [Acholeplasmataceae bacterium]
MSKSILKAREERYETIKKLSYTYPHLIVLKANTPGNDKNRYSAFFLIEKLNKSIIHKFDINYKTLKKGFDGPYYVYSISCDYPMNIKKELIEIETNHPLGRLIDLDFYVNSEIVSRTDFNQELRSCMICNHSAIDCMRNNRHSLDDVLNHIDKVILEYLKINIASIIKDTMLSELNLENKFGLVTPTSNGSHEDMNYDMMYESIDVLIPYFLDIFELGFKSKGNDSLFEEARIIGIKAEQDMLKHSNQVNTYKGLIYILGIVLLSLGKIVKNNKPLSYLSAQVRELSVNVLEDFKLNMISSGIKAYKEHDVKGIRGEVFNGLPTIVNALEKFRNIDNEDSKYYHQILLFFMINAEDTVLLKRCQTIEKYNQIKNMITKVDPYDIEDIKTFTKYCIKHNLSFGGSADLFIVYQFIKKIEILIK